MSRKSRNKPYKKSLLFIDIILTCFTGGGWLLIVGFRELYHAVN